MHPEIEPTPHLISCKELEKTNFETVSRFVNDSLLNFFGQNGYQDKVLLFVTDAAPYMLKTGNALKVFYPNMVHTTCVAHGLNRVAEKIREVFQNVNKLISCGKKIFLKAPQRVALYRNVMNCPLPPEAVLTRWGTWIDAALFYSENLDRYAELIERLEEDALAITKLKSIVKNNSVKSELAFIRSHFSPIPVAIKRLEAKNLSLDEQINIVQSIEETLKKVNNDKGKLIYEKFQTVFEKNLGFKILQTFNDVLNGKRSDVDVAPNILSSYKKCPITSIDVERAFSLLKHILDDRRYNLTEKNLEMYMVVNFNEKN